MDDFVAGTYMRELVNQGANAQIAAQDFNAALVAAHDCDAALVKNYVSRTFAAAQLLLAAAAMISKLLWTKPKNKRGPDLRSKLQIEETSVSVLKNRKVRNGLEHFDERLDRYFSEGHRNVIDQNIADRGRILVNGKPPMHLRLIDPTRKTISVLDDEVSLQELADAVADVTERAKDWLSTNQ